MKLLIKAEKIPLGSRVTKATGEKVYILRDRIRIFSGTGAPVREVVASEGTVFIVDPERGDALAFPNDRVLGWVVEPDVLRDYLDRLLSKDDK